MACTSHSICGSNIERPPAFLWEKKYAWEAFCGRQHISFRADSSTQLNSSRDFFCGFTSLMAYVRQGWMNVRRASSFCHGASSDFVMRWMCCGWVWRLCQGDHQCCGWFRWEPRGTYMILPGIVLECVTVGWCSLEDRQKWHSSLVMSW